MLFGRCEEFTLPVLQEQLLALTDVDVFPHRATVDDGLRELAHQVGSQCEERGLLVEYMRRHYVDAVHVSLELLRILQGTLRINEQLRNATDETLTRAFQGFLGETMKALQDEGGEPEFGSAAQPASTMGAGGLAPQRSLQARTLV